MQFRTHNQGMMQFCRCAASCLAVLAGLLLLSATVQAQVLYGSLTGTITDPSKAVVPNASVEAQNVATSVARTATTNEVGVYLLTLMQPGVYKVTISAAGFGKSVTDNVAINANALRRLDVQLQVAKVNEVVTVEAGAVALQTDRADVSSQLRENQITNLPITSSAGRSYQALYRILPGFTVPQETNSAAGNPQRSMTSNVNGLSTQGISTRIDGALDTYIWLPANVAYVPPADSVQEVSVVTDAYDAEQGALGAAVNVITKSGTNSFHGEGYEFHNDNALRAFNRFAAPCTGRDCKPKDILNQYGGNFGGPVIKDKLFFFTDFEGTKRRQFAQATRSVPNPASIFDSAGNVSFLSAIPAGTDCNKTKVAGCIYDPNTGNADGTGRIAFANNTIPANRIDAAAKIMLTRIDPSGFLNNTGVTAVNNYQSTHPAAFNRNNWDEKVNWTPNEKTQIFARYSLSQADISDTPLLGDAGGDSTAGGQPGDALSRIQAAGAGVTYTISPRTLYDLNIGYTRQRLGAQAQDIALGAFGLNTLHIPGTNGGDIMQAGIPSFQIGNGYWANMGNPNTGSPFLFRDNSYVANTNLSWMKRTHEVRFGFEYTRDEMNHFQPQGGSFQTARGTFTFLGNATASGDSGAASASGQYNGLAQFLLGIASRSGKAIQFINPNSIRWRTFAFYIRDRWQVTPKLTMTYGLRYEYYPMATADHGGTRVFDPVSGNVYIGGYGTVPMNDYIDVGRGMFLPRFGIAYRLAPKTVVRLGYGMAADNNNFRYLRNAYPVTVNTDNNPTGFTPAASLTGETLAPYPTLAVGIPTATYPNVSSGVVPLPSGTGTSTIDQKYHRGYINSFNLTLQHEFWGFVGEAGYVGNRGTNLATNYNINPAPLGGGNTGRVLNAAHGTNWSDINSVGFMQNSYYDSLQTKLTKRFSGNSMISAVYTFSKAIDWEDNEELNALSWPYIAYQNRNKALAGFDRPHMFALYGVYELPFGPKQSFVQKGVGSKIAGGWQMNWMLTKVSGTPLTITGGGASYNAAGSTQTADQVGAINILGGVGPVNGAPACAATDMSCHYFDPTAFAAVPTGQVRFGTSGRDILRGPGYFNLDLSLFRDFKLTEALKLQFRAEGFSITNTPHLNNPGTNVTTPSTFGVITSTFNPAGQMPGSGGERWFWFAMKLMF
jgi:hypothetical protein